MNDTEERAWEVVRRAFEERPPVRPRRRLSNRLLLGGVAGLLAAVLAGAVLTSPGHAFFERVRQAIGLKHAAPELFSLPAPGRLLVVSAAAHAVWVVDADGSRRLLSGYADARWSPHGLYLVATRREELVALDPRGGVRWTLGRHRPSSPRWEGTYADTRIAYSSGGALRVVAGDGSGDHLLDRAGGSVAPAWDPARLHTVAYYARGRIELRRDDGRLVWSRPVAVRPLDLEWTSDGRYLAVFAARRVVVLDAAGDVRRSVSLLAATRLSGSFRPGTHELAIAMRLAGRSEVRELDVDRPGSARLVFAGPGAFGDLAWSPDGGWLLVTWPAADQWVFLHGARAHAVGRIDEQFSVPDRPGQALEVAGRWCCSR